MSLPYLDDFATIRPVIDHPVRAPDSNYDPHLRFKSEDELASDLATWVENLPDDADRVEWMKFEDSLRLTVGKESAERAPRSALAPAIPPLADPNIRYENETADSDGAEDAEPHVKRLMKQTGYTREQIRRFRIKVLVTKRVVNVTRMGKISSMYFLAIAGNGRGLLGVGEGKADEPEAAREQATMAAIRNMVPIARYEDRTIFGDVKGKVGAVELELFTRPPGGCYFRLSLRRCLKRPTWLILDVWCHRVWDSLPAVHLRDVSVRGHFGSGGEVYAGEESDEYDQGDDAGVAEPAVAGGYSEGEGEEVGGCTEGVLCGECVDTPGANQRCSSCIFVDS